ncbi:MAG: DUF3325 family protein [Burkholderiales bacterium]|nr:DUF3325 family protein [Burkholderiales bacterium]
MMIAFVAFLLALTGMVALHLAVSRHHARVFGYIPDAGRRLRLRLAGLTCLTCPALFSLALGLAQYGIGREDVGQSQVWGLSVIAASLAALPSTALPAWQPRWMPFIGSAALSQAISSGRLPRCRPACSACLHAARGAPMRSPRLPAWQTRPSAYHSSAGWAGSWSHRRQSLHEGLPTRLPRHPVGCPHGTARHRPAAGPDHA